MKNKKDILAINTLERFLYLNIDNFGELPNYKIGPVLRTLYDLIIKNPNPDVDKIIKYFSSGLNILEVFRYINRK